MKKWKRKGNEKNWRDLTIETRRKATLICSFHQDLSPVYTVNVG